MSAEWARSLGRYSSGSLRVTWAPDGVLSQSVQAGQEEAQGGAGGERGQGVALGGAERADVVVGVEQGAGHRRVDAAVLEAPAVEADGEVVGQEVGAGEVEVDQAGEFAFEKEDVVGEQVGVDVAGGQVRGPVAVDVGRGGG